MKNIYLSVLLLFNIAICKAQPFYDTLSIVHYNILRYGSPGISCTPLPVSEKNPYLRTFINYTLPDVFSVNEIGNSQLYVDYLLNDVLNTNGRTQYKAAIYASNGDDIGDIIFYNSTKIQLVGQSIISCTPRSFFLYNFKYVNPSKADDNAFFTCIIGHLKASNGSAFEAERAGCAANIMAHLSTNYTTTGNYFVMGDFNIYKTTEAAIANFTTNSNTKINFYDPVYALTSTAGKSFYIGNNTSIGTGTWNNAQFAPYHTQCAAAGQLNCGSGGGMDDRFDYIFTNRSVLDDSAKLNYIPGSYKAIGNDGLHYNKSINDGPNDSAPAEVIAALYNISDHLPVALKVRIDVELKPIVQPITTTSYIGSVFKSTASIFFTNANTTISGIYKSSLPNFITITGIKNLTTLPGTFTTITGTYTDNGTVFAMDVSEFTSPLQLITGTGFKSATNLALYSEATTITGGYKLGSYNQITISGLNAGTLSTITGFFTMDAQLNFRLNIINENTSTGINPGTTTGINDIMQSTNAIRISPNPFESYFTINMPLEIANHIIVSISDIYGNELMASKLDETMRVYVAGIAKGLYLVQLSMPDGSKVMLKAVKE